MKRALKGFRMLDSGFRSKQASSAPSIMKGLHVAYDAGRIATASTHSDDGVGTQFPISKSTLGITYIS